MSFAQLNLNQNIFKAITACGYKTPTPIQARSIPDILLGKDLVASAQTGTGKTAAFVLPALHRLSLKKSTIKPRILILTPTRELATQITQAADTYGKFLRFNIVSLVGGMPYRQQLKRLSRPVDIIVATPGRLLDHMKNHRLDLSAIEMLVLDEADRMLDMGFIDDVKDITKVTPKSRQTLLFSATVDEKLSQVINHLLKDPVRIDLSQETLSPAQIKQEIYLADNLSHRAELLEHFLTNEKIFKGIIFTATKINADKLAKQIYDQGFATAPLHGDLKQKVRMRTIEQFRRGKVQFLIATDVAARGIDINDVTHVINLDLPRFAEDYVHRIGRTGRAQKSGVAISFVLPSEVRALQKIEKYLGQKLDMCTVEGLEPTRRMKSNSQSDNPSKKNHRKGFGFKKEGRGRNEKSSKRFDSRDSANGKSSKYFGSQKEGSKEKSAKRGSRFGSQREDAKERGKRFGAQRDDDKGRKTKFGSSQGEAKEKGSKFGSFTKDGAKAKGSKHYASKKEGSFARKEKHSRPFSSKKEGSNFRRSDKNKNRPE